MSPILIVFLILISLLFLVAVAWVVLSAFFDLSDRRYIAPASGSRRVTEPVCGRCGYRVRGLNSFDCPECGADLREVGIITPGLIRAIGSETSGCGIPVAWTSGLFVFGFLFYSLIGPRLPLQWRQGGWYEFLSVLLFFCLWIGGLALFSVKPKQNTKNTEPMP